MRLRNLTIAGVFALLLAGAAPAQEAPEERILKAIDKTMEKEMRRIRADLLKMVRAELRKLSAGSQDNVKGFDGALNLITVDVMKKHAMTLASDKYKGRNAGYEGNNMAAKYIAAEFRRLGLKPVGDKNEDNEKTYLQHFSFRSFYTGGRNLKTQNVVGLWEGTDPNLKKEIVVVGGHFDHVGMGSQGRHLGRLGRPSDEDEIWNGADDNGSGTTCVLSLARAFAQGKVKTKRSILFILFSAEEAGLYGSKYYCKNPIAPISDHVFMLNLDMVGRNPNKPVQIKGVGSAKGNVIEDSVKQALAKTRLKAKIEKSSTIFGGDSDHSSFKAKGVPFAFFFSGFHADYHRVTDHPEKLAYANMVKVAKTSAYLLRDMANRTHAPQFMGRSGRRPLEFGDLEKNPPRSRRLLGVTIEPLNSEECNELGLADGRGGVRVDTVNPRGVAKKAGIRPEDVLVSLGGKTLGRKNPRDDLRKAIQSVKPGKAVDVVLFRDEKKVVVKATWTK